MTRYQLRKQLEVLALDGQILVGSLPPIGLVLEDPPAYLADLLEFFSTPRTITDVRVFLSDKAQLSDSDLEQLLRELMDANIIVEPMTDLPDRYSRHCLYFDLIDLNPRDAQAILSTKKVGLVGMGGIGSNVAMILAGAGVGTIVFSDGDVVEKSNLTRQFLYNESFVGSPKVSCAVRQLSQLNSSVRLVPVVESIAGEDLFDRHFADCNFVVLSADWPKQIHSWINNAAFRYGFAYSNAGYTESYGVIGPLTIPGLTACYECSKQPVELGRSLNHSYQAPSYGPLNSLVASIQANEIIRYLLGLETKTKGCRLLIRSEDYRIFEDRLDKKTDCAKCQTARPIKSNKPVGASVSVNGRSLHDLYVAEREHDSFNALLLDDLTERLIEIHPGTTILDVGCATGEQTLRFVEKGAHVVANDTSAEMLRHLGDRVPANCPGTILTVQGAIEQVEITGHFDYIVCNNVLDFITDIRPVLAKFSSLLKDDGTLMVTLPHPAKDRGSWRKELYNGKWNYVEFQMDHYFNEGPVEKSREDREGNLAIACVHTFHRTTQTYFKTFMDSGFNVVGLFEPSPDPSARTSHPILYEKCSRIPYFQVFMLMKRGGQLTAGRQ